MVSFGARYAKYYDILYSDKDYASECDFLESVFRKYGDNKISSILDFACGTGGHTILLARRGYDVAAMDSSPHMLKLAERKAAKSGAQVDFRRGSMTSIPFRRKFDACISMFDSIDYLPDMKAVVKAFNTVGAHLRQGGIFVVQFWNGPAVLRLGLRQRYKEIEDGGLKLIRLSDPTPGRDKDNCLVRYRIVGIQGRSVVDDFREEHFVRYFWPNKMKLALARSGLAMTKLLKPFSPILEADNRDWSVIAVAKRQGTSQAGSDA